MNNALVLAFSFGPADSKKLRSICDKLGVRLRKVQPAEYGEPLGAFAGLREHTDQPASVDGATGQMLVFAGLTERQLDHFLSALRTLRVSGDTLKAVLTETNAKWTAPELYAELLRERESMRAQAPDSQ